MATRQDNEGWIRDGHKVTIFLDGDTIYLKLTCPESGCVPGRICGQCGHAYGDAETEPCYDCRGERGPTECWLMSWADNVQWEELHTHDERDLSGLTLPAPIEYRPSPSGEGEPEWRFV